MSRENIENKIQEFMEFSFFADFDKAELKKYLFQGEGKIPKQLPVIKTMDIRYDESFNVMEYLDCDFFDEDYSERQIDIYKRWIILLEKMIGKEFLDRVNIMDNINKLNWSLKEYSETFNISVKEIVEKQLKHRRTPVCDKIILEFLEMEGENKVVESFFKGHFSSINMHLRIKFASIILPVLGEDNKGKVLSFVKDNIKAALIENISSYKHHRKTIQTDKKAVTALKDYFENRDLRKTADILRKKLHKEYSEYTVLDNNIIKTLMRALLKLVKIDGDFKYLIELLQEVFRFEFLIIADYVYEIEFENLEEYKEAKKKFMEGCIEEKYAIAYNLHIVERLFKQPKDLLIEIIKYEGEKIKEALDCISHKLRAKICFYIIDMNKDEFYVNYTRKTFERIFEDNLKRNFENREEYFEYYIWFLDFEEINNTLKKIKKNMDQSLAKNLMSAFLYVFDCENKVQMLVKLLMSLDINLKDFVNISAYYADRGDSLRPVIVEFFKYHKLSSKKSSSGAEKTINIFDFIKSEIVETKLNLLDVVFNDDELGLSQLKGALTLFKDKSKQVRECCAQKFCGIDDLVFESYLDDFKEFINESKEDIRLLAVEVLSNHLEMEEVKVVLEERFKVETGVKARSVIMELLDLDPAKMYVDDNGEFDLLAYFQSLKVKKSESAVDFSTLPKIRFKGREEYVPEEILNYFVKAYLNSSELKLIKDAAIVSEALNSEDLAKFANEIFANYIDHSIESKKKGLILLAAVHGDYDTVQNLKKLIDELASNSRHKLAQYTVKALVLNGSSQALIIVNSIKNKYKYKSVKDSAREAFKLAAKEFNMNIAELEDKIVPNLGFEGLSCKEYDYGNRIIKVYLNNKLELEVENEKGKIVKSLPKASKNDIEENVTKAKEDFKNLKKELKAVKKFQIERLEEALLSFRTWSAEAWKELFMNNPIMNRLGKFFVWGIYEGESLKQEFLYDDNLFDLDYEEIELQDNMKIGLVHPLELEEEKIESWKEILEENEIIQPFSQLTRTIYTAEEDKEIIYAFKDIKINDAKLIKRFTDMGWYKGSVTDGGCYYEYYREWEELGLGVEITVDDYLDFYDVGYKDIAIKTLEFYKAGAVERGSYIYDEVDKERRIHPKDISKRLYSEVIYSVYKVLN